jgi:hypothetical protein
MAENQKHEEPVQQQGLGLLIASAVIVALCVYCAWFAELPIPWHALRGPVFIASVLVASLAGVVFTIAGLRGKLIPVLIGGIVGLACGIFGVEFLIAASDPNWQPAFGLLPWIF